MESKITIFSVVDVIEALSGGTLGGGNLCMMDNSPLESLNQGTTQLCTKCYPGQEIYWHILALDVQTPVAIRNITFISTHGHEEQTLPVENVEGAQSDTLHLKVWSGIVPYSMLPNVPYRYRFEMQAYEGINSIMSVDTPSLMRVM